MPICEQKIQHNSVNSELITFMWCWPPSLCCCSMYLKHNVHTIMLENGFQQHQCCTNHWWQVAWGTIFCAAVPRYCWVLSVELPSCHITGIWNIKVPSRFWRTLCILEWHYSKSSICHVTCILFKLFFNIWNFWMVQRFLLSHTHTIIYIYIYIYIYICVYGNVPYSLYVF